MDADVFVICGSRWFLLYVQWDRRGSTGGAAKVFQNGNNGLFMAIVETGLEARRQTGDGRSPVGSRPQSSSHL